MDRHALTELLCSPEVESILKNRAAELAVHLPEIAPMFGFEQHNPHHDKDVWLHTVAVVAGIRPEPVLRWAALLHDIGKPGCFSMDENGVGHFYGHAERSTQLSEDILSRLGFESESQERILRLVRYHDLPLTAERKPLERLLRKHGAEVARQLIELHRADTLGLSPLFADRLAEFDAIEVLLDDILAEQERFSLKDLAINGSDLISLGYTGKAIGTALQACLTAVLTGQAANDRDSLLVYLANTSAL